MQLTPTRSTLNYRGLASRLRTFTPPPLPSPRPPNQTSSGACRHTDSPTQSHYAVFTVQSGQTNEMARQEEGESRSRERRDDIYIEVWGASGSPLFSVSTINKIVSSLLCPCQQQSHTHPVPSHHSITLIFSSRLNTLSKFFILPFHRGN